MESTDPKRRVLIVERDDGHYGLIEQRWRENVWEGRLAYEGWIAIYQPKSIFQTVQIAEREARASFPELSLK